MCRYLVSLKWLGGCGGRAWRARTAVSPWAPWRSAAPSRPWGGRSPRPPPRPGAPPHPGCPRGGRRRPGRRQRRPPLGGRAQARAVGPRSTPQIHRRHRSTPTTRARPLIGPASVRNPPPTSDRTRLTQSVDPTSSPDRPQLCPQVGPSRPQTDPRSTPDLPQIDPNIIPRSTTDRPQVEPRSTACRSLRIRSTADRPPAPRSTQNRPPSPRAPQNRRWIHQVGPFRTKSVDFRAYSCLCHRHKLARPWRRNDDVLEATVYQPLLYCLELLLDTGKTHASERATKRSNKKTRTSSH